MNNPSQFSTFPRLQKKPGPAEMEALLDLLPEASILLDLQTQRIVFANARALELTTYARKELAGISFGSLFPASSNPLQVEAEEGQPPVSHDLLRRNRSTVSVHLQRHDLAPQGHWSIISMVDAQLLEQRASEQTRRESVVRSMQTISQAYEQPDLESSLNLLLAAAEVITGAQITSIYLQRVSPADAQPEVIRFMHRGTDEVFPTTVPGVELISFRSMHLWSAGKRPLSSLHRAGRAAGLNHIITAPLGQHQALIGFLLLAGDFPRHVEAVAQQAKILAITITSFIEHYSQQEHLKKSIAEANTQAVFQQVLENAVNDGVMILSKDLRIVRINRMAESLLGYTQHEVVERLVQDILISSHPLAHAIDQALQGSAMAIDEPVALYRRNGQTFQASVSILPAFSSKGLHGLIILFQDLSEREKIEAKSQQLEQQASLGEVTAIFAHEVRNPINNISTGLQLMSYNLAGDDPNQALIGRLRQDCDRLSDLMKSVLAFAKPSDYSMNPVDIGGLVRRLLERQQPRLEKENIHIHLEVKAGTPLVRGDTRALEQVFTNLMTNAAQAINKRGGTIAFKIQALHTGNEQRFVRIDVADDGPGIPPDVQEHLFTPFFTTKADGTGLGLPLTKRIITAHKGHIGFKSFPGGTIFTIQLPAMEDA